MKLILDFAKLSHLLLSPMLVREVTVLAQIYIIIILSYNIIIIIVYMHKGTSARR